MRFLQGSFGSNALARSAPRGTSPTPAYRGSDAAVVIPGASVTPPVGTPMTFGHTGAFVLHRTKYDASGSPAFFILGVKRGETNAQPWLEALSTGHKSIDGQEQYSVTATDYWRAQSLGAVPTETAQGPVPFERGCDVYVPCKDPRFGPRVGIAMTVEASTDEYVIASRKSPDDAWIPTGHQLSNGRFMLPVGEVSRTRLGGTEYKEAAAHEPVEHRPVIEVRASRGPTVPQSSSPLAAGAPRTGFARFAEALRAWFARPSTREPLVEGVFINGRVDLSNTLETKALYRGLKAPATPAPPPDPPWAARLP